MQIRIGEIYRHASGSFYTIIALSSISLDSGVKDIVVVKKLSSLGETVTYFVDEFFKDIELDKYTNPMGQKTLFVRVKDASCTLAETTTEALIEELKTRLDNPYAKEGDPKVFEVVYEVGVYKPYKRSDLEHRGQYYFEVLVTKDTFDSAVNFIKNHWSNSLRPVIMRVTRAEELRSQDLIDNRFM